VYREAPLSDLLQCFDQPIPNSGVNLAEADFQTSCTEAQDVPHPLDVLELRECPVTQVLIEKHTVYLTNVPMRTPFYDLRQSIHRYMLEAMRTLYFDLILSLTL
jgi:hypothetical protein